MLLPGWGFGPNVYRRSLDVLAHTGFRLAAPDLRSLGRHWSAKRAVEAVVGQMDRQGWNNAAVVGHSLGGAVAVLLAHTAPSRVSHLIVVDSIGLPVDRSMWGWAVPFLGYTGTAFPTPATELVKGCMTLDRLWGLTRSAIVATRTDVSEALSAIPRTGVTSTVIWGNHDRLLPARARNRIRRATRLASRFRRRRSRLATTPSAPFRSGHHRRTDATASAALQPTRRLTATDARQRRRPEIERNCGQTCHAGHFTASRHEPYDVPSPLTRRCPRHGPG